MRKQLTRWLSLLGHSCGANLKAVLDRRELRLRPTLFFHLCSDAMYDPSRAGMGGFCHGLYWSLVIPAEHIPSLSIPILEFLGVAFNFVVFAPALKHLVASNPRATVVVRTDALTAALTLPAESQRCPLLVAACQWLRDQPEYQQLAHRCLITHLFGDANPIADALSRKKLCIQLSAYKMLSCGPNDHKKFCENNFSGYFLVRQKNLCVFLLPPIAFSNV